MRWLAACFLATCLVSSPVLAQEEEPAADDTTTEAGQPEGEEGAEAAEATAPEGEAAEPAAEPADAAPAETTEVEAAPADAAPAPVEEVGEPAAEEGGSLDLERIIVASVAGAVAVAGLATGITFGILAQQEYDCLKDVVACNQDRDDPLEGTEFLDARAEVERKALYADMGYLVALTAATVAVVGAIELLFGADAEAAE